MERVVEPEWLDDLSPADKEARQSRRDLRRLNQIMRHRPILLEHVRNLVAGRSEVQMVELGAGDGTLIQEILMRLAEPLPKVRLTLVDRQPVVSDSTQSGLSKMGVEVKLCQEDVFAWLRNAPRTDLIMANLFLHHFKNPELQELFSLAAQNTSGFICCEPRRSWMAYLAAAGVFLVGCNRITRHDATISVRAGFKGDELTGLWGRNSEWETSEREAGLFSHLFFARRRPASSQ